MALDIDYAIDRLNNRAWEIRFNLLALSLNKGYKYYLNEDKSLEEALYYEQVATWLTELKEIKSKTDPTKEADNSESSGEEVNNSSCSEAIINLEELLASYEWINVSYEKALIFAINRLKEEKLITDNHFSRWKEDLKRNIEAWLNMDKYYHPYSKSKNIPISELMDVIDNTKEA